MNVLDNLKNTSVENIKQYCFDKTIDAGVAMINVAGDFNFSTMVRNANFFGFRSVYHIAPKKKWDKRGSVGTHNYTPVFHFYDFETLFDSLKKDGYMVFAIENNIPSYSWKTVSLYDYLEPINRIVFLFGEEKNGLSADVLDLVDGILTIPGYGSVRSLNVGTASGIVLGHHRNLMESLDIS